MVTWKDEYLLRMEEKDDDANAAGAGRKKMKHDVCVQSVSTSSLPPDAHCSYSAVSSNTNFMELDHVCAFMFPIPSLVYLWKN